MLHKWVASIARATWFWEGKKPECEKSHIESRKYWKLKALCFQVDLLSVRLLWHWISCERFDMFSSHEKWNQFNAILWTCFFSLLFIPQHQRWRCGALKWRRIPTAIWISRTRNGKIDIMWSIWIPDAKVRLVVQMLEINDPPIPALNTLSLFFLVWILPFSIESFIFLRISIGTLLKMSTFAI